METGNVFACSATVEQLQADTLESIGERITKLLPPDALSKGDLIVKMSGFHLGGLVVREYDWVTTPLDLGKAVKNALRFVGLYDHRVEFIWSHGDERVVIDLKIVG